jgi:hypothetical protein
VLAGRDVELLRWWIFLIQLAVHLGACWLFARRVAGAFGSDALGRVTFGLVVLNPFLLIMTGLLLTDLLSAALIAVAAALLLPTRDDRPVTVIRDGMLALLALTFSVEVRPANAVLLPVAALFWTVRWWLAARPDLRRFAGGLALVGIVAALPLVPQVLINWQVHGQFSPLTVRSLYAEQASWGISYLKYVTFDLRDKGGEPAVFYRSPFRTDAPDLVSFTQARPRALLATLALHAFALVDQDFPFPYVREIDAWYRWPLSALNYLLLWAMAVGLVVGWRDWWRPGTRLAWTVLLGLAGAYVLVYLPTAIEARFGLPLFILLAPAAGLTLLAARDWLRACAWGRLVGAGMGAVLVVAACAWLSAWMQAQAPVIVMTRELQRLPALEPPSARFEAASPDRWTVDQRQTYRVRVANLGQQPWFTLRPARAILHVMFVGPGDAETVDTRVEAQIPIARDVPPGDVLEMDVTVSAPRKEGAYRLRQQVELEGMPGLTALPPAETPVLVDIRRPSRGR